MPKKILRKRTIPFRFYLAGGAFGREMNHPVYHSSYLSRYAGVRNGSRCSARRRPGQIARRWGGTSPGLLHAADSSTTVRFFQPELGRCRPLSVFRLSQKMTPGRPGVEAGLKPAPTGAASFSWLVVPAWRRGGFETRPYRCSLIFVVGGVPRRVHLLESEQLPPWPRFDDARGGQLLSQKIASGRLGVEAGLKPAPTGAASFSWLVVSRAVFICSSLNSCRRGRGLTTPAAVNYFLRK